MSVDLSRRSLLFGRKPPREEITVFRPPWASDQFTEICTRCTECISACPSQIIVKGDGGFPEINFHQGECNFCGQCQTVCTPKALNATLAWQLYAEIGASCLAQQGVDCRVCAEMCEASAIQFALQVGTVAQPQLNQDACTGCGACIAPCPSSAIQMQQVK